jgi:hypothetical protein
MLLVLYSMQMQDAPAAAPMGAEEEAAAGEPIIGPLPPPPAAAAADADSSDADEYEEGAQQHSSVCSTTARCI